MVRSRSCPGLVVQGLDRLDLQGGMQAELIELESFVQAWFRIVGPFASCRANDRLSCGPVPCVFPSWERRRLVEGSFGMDMADEVDVGRQLTRGCFAAVGAVTGDEDLIVGKPGGGQDNQFEGQFRPGAMIRIVLGLVLLGLLAVLLLPLGESLAVAIETDRRRARRRLWWGPRTDER